MRLVLVLAVLLTLLLPGSAPGQVARRRGPVAATATAGPYSGPAVTFRGTLKALTKKELIMDLDATEAGTEQQSVTFRITRKTKFSKNDRESKPSDLAIGTHVTVDATRDGDLKLSALNVMTASSPL